MSHTTSLRRTASALGATALLGVVLAAPAMARQDAGVPAVDSATTSQFPYGLERSQREGESTTTSQFPYGLERSQREGESTTTSQFPYGLERSQREGNLSSVDEQPRLGGFTKPNERSLGTSEVSKPSPVIVVRDNDAIEYLQVGAGVLAGIVVAGAGAVIVSRRNHGGLTPA